jgi:hypothetical protein
VTLLVALQRSEQPRHSLDPDDLHRILLRDLNTATKGLAKVHGFFSVRRHEDLCCFVVIANGTLIERRFQATAPQSGGPRARRPPPATVLVLVTVKASRFAMAFGHP